MPLSRYLAALVACTLASTMSLSGRTAELSDWSAARQSIQATQLQEHVIALADDTFEGREAGTRGGRAAAGYLLRRLEEAKLSPAGEDGGYFQSFGNSYRNILVYLEGSDPRLKDEVIVIGAHYDHVGYGRSGNSLGPAGYIHNGADDNASGVATMLETIDAVTELSHPPRRSVLFAFWDAEERGLLGAKHWVGHPTIPLSRVAYYINLDMVGRMRNNRLMVFGSRSGDGSRRLVSELNDTEKMTIDFTWELKENSDHWPFLQRGIPVLMPHTDKHGDYHRPSDDPERINAAGMEQAARLTFSLLHQLAMRDEIPKFRPAWRYENESTHRQSERRLADHGSRLGVAWGGTMDDEGPIVVGHIAPYSSAAKAGLRLGDRIIGVGSKTIVNGNDMRAAMVSEVPETSLRVIREGSEQAMELPIRLAGTPVRVGLSWRNDPAEPDTIFITRVVSGSPAEIAGVRIGDRVYRLNGEIIEEPEQWYTAFTEQEFPIELVLERDGRLRTVVLDEHRFAPLEPLPVETAEPSDAVPVP